MICRECGRPVSRDEIAITKKMVSRASEEYYCAECLAKEFRISVEDVNRLIERFRAAGCSLFQ